MTITRMRDARTALAFVQRPYTSFYDRLYDEPAKPWEALEGSDALGRSSRCYSRTDTSTVGEGSVTMLREVCLVGSGSYVLQVTGSRAGGEDGPSSSPEVLEHTAAIKDWLENGAK